MKIATSPPAKSHPPLKTEVLSSPPTPFLKIWLKVLTPPPPPPLPAERRGAQYAYLITPKLAYTLYEFLWLYVANGHIKIISEWNINKFLRNRSCFFHNLVHKNFRLVTERCSHPMRLQDSLIINISRRKQSLC